MRSAVFAGQLAQDALCRSLVHASKQRRVIQVVIQHIQLFPILEACEPGAIYESFISPSTLLNYHKVADA